MDLNNILEENNDFVLNEEYLKEILFENYIKFSNREKQNSSILPRYGDIYTCDLGINIGSELDNIRPCIIITNTKYNEKSTVVTIIPISKKQKTFFHQVEINKDTVKEIESKIDGIAKIEQIRTISKGRLGRKIGEMSIEGMELINKALIFQFSIKNKL